ncbi:hypothetical protein [Streptosporangium canum]|uniref:hypothetical protein n=1 Tax=Streptosporangium canum TaxID=324952 RepID=UPI003F4BBA03
MELVGSAERTLVADYSTDMRKKIGLATALLHGPKLLVLDEPFEAVAPVSATTILIGLAGFGGMLAVYLAESRKAKERARAELKAREEALPPGSVR